MLVYVSFSQPATAGTRKKGESWVLVVGLYCEHAGYSQKPHWIRFNTMEDMLERASRIVDLAFDQVPGFVVAHLRQTHHQSRHFIFPAIWV